MRPFLAMDILEASKELERKGESIVHFSIGEPDFRTPDVAVKASIEALREYRTKYTHSQGLYDLREAIAANYKQNYNVDVNPDCIIVTQGSSQAFFLLFSTLINEGDEVVLPNPHYPCDANFVEFFGGKIAYLRIKESDGYQWNIDLLKKLINPRTKAIFVTSPSNPTGTILRPEILNALNQFNVTVISDEIYHGLSYDHTCHTMLEFNKNCFVINGFSKAYAMTGFRLGYLIAPRKYVRSLQMVQQNFAISANSFVQEAGIAALQYAQNDLNYMREEFRKRREVMILGLRDLGFKVEYVPEGAFYVFVNAQHLSMNSYDLAFDILNKAKVAVTPGIDFGSAGEGYLRFSYAVSEDQIREGMRRLKLYLQGI